MSTIDLVVVISLGVFAVSFVCLTAILIPVCRQLINTLQSAQSLIDTVNDDVQPMIKDFRSSVDGVRNVVGKCSGKARGIVHDAGIALISSSQGVLVGLKNYLSSVSGSKNSFNGKK